ncbi:NfeD family protein [Undibacterium sp. LX40W]|uniref:NfeD family protein n=1 Tax=Undibacterium nitidum TaxID=2762298 RepID=A0A923HPG6_9BURK|nr:MULTISPECIES: NfeD family protein [Undibacterium]MBC3880072.1 NfeD family protein [Undibacterium nitidum]MBC3891192.1 NfeD family protein [Undibacterium sp. LX40W]
MDAWMMWLVLAGLVVILELFTGTFYLLMISVGLLAGAGVAAIGFASPFQLLVAAIVGSIATISLHFSRFGWKQRGEASRDPNVNIDIGQQLTVAEWIEIGQGKYTARTKYRGALWDVELHQGRAEAGLFEIEEVVGSRLIVKSVN